MGTGLGLDALKIQMEANGENWPVIEFRGNVDFNYTGLQLCLKVYY